MPVEAKLRLLRAQLRGQEFDVVARFIQLFGPIGFGRLRAINDFSASGEYVRIDSITISTD